MAGGLNLYGYANGDPVNFSDPFGLCPDENDPDCEALQTILTLTWGATVAIAPALFNVEFGLAIGTETDDAIWFARGGPSMGAGLGEGLEVGAIAGRLNDFTKATGTGAGATLQATTPYVGISLTVSEDSPIYLTGLKIGQRGLGAWVDLVGDRSNGEPMAVAGRSRIGEGLWRALKGILNDNE